MRGRLLALLEARAARRRARIVAALADMGVEAVVEGDDVRASGPGLAERWWRDRALRDVGRDGR
ncbi:hypothetical protein [Sphingobium sp. WCS2017Hpa-17]|uniref:hypothetical protein n=1 Tax=Sphingobium sp. WCS2017Hpa-17 TaxID=3073638 RepID=UPI002889B394|nr:hypothetical protein [Sphingobium sp. WCS2017Hpa-17]